MESIRITRCIACYTKSLRPSLYHISRYTSAPSRRLAARPPNARHASTTALPKLAQPSFWRSIIPKALRGGTSSIGVPSPAAKIKRPRNPATFFLVAALLIGSQAIQSVALHADFARFSRETETQLARLREVIRALQAGEEVDVEAALGTGNKAREREWEDVMRELEQEDAVLQLKAKRRLERRRAKEEEAQKEAAKAEGRGS